MSRDSHREPRAEPTGRGDRFSLRRWANNWRWLVLALWLGACAWIAWRIGSGIAITGDLDALLPSEHRAPTEDVLVLLRVGDEGVGASPRDELLAAADRVHERVKAWTPIAPPATEIAGWLDAHALMLLPPSAHAQLKERLTDAAMQTAVDGLRARLSSPFFGLTRDDARRDPLQLQSLTDDAAARFGHVVEGTPAGAEVTAGGDLIAGEGDSLLLLLRSDEPVEHIVDEVEAAVGQGAVSVALVGPQRQRQQAAELLRSHWKSVLGWTLTAITLVLTLVLRRIRPTLVIVASLASAVAIVLVSLPPLDPIGFPLVVLACGMACEGALWLQRISARGWPAASVLATALLPLWLSDYPLWQQWSVSWAVAIVFIMLVLRLVPPALLGVVGGSASFADRGFRLRPMPVLALLLAATTLGLGAWAAERLPYRGADRIQLGDALVSPEQKTLTEDYFDPSLVARAPARGDDPAKALVAASEVTRALSTLVPAEATRIDSPGSLVLPAEQLEQRKAALAGLDLPGRMATLRDMLEAGGFRPDAFGEFLRSAADPNRSPTPEAMLEGPLGRWTRRYLQVDDEAAVLDSRVHLSADPEAAVPSLVTDTGTVVDLHGPAVAARRDREGFGDWLGIFSLCQLWLGGLLMWLGTRSLAVAFSAMFASLVTQTAVLAAMVGLQLPLSPVMIPALLLTGAAGMIAAGRACRAADTGEPLFAMGLLTTSACQVAAGLALVQSGVPAWMQVGWVTAIGCAVASGAGLFVAPGLTSMLRKVMRSPSDPDPASTDTSSTEDDER